MSRLHNLSLSEIDRILRKYGCSFQGQEGSHRKYWKEGLTRPIIVPCHKGKTVPPFIVLQIIRALGTTREEFLKYV
jgi:predicted RNA binding protein YcfA (HicA-like mRNA interferase family)